MSSNNGTPGGQEPQIDPLEQRVGTEEYPEMGQEYDGAVTPTIEEDFEKADEIEELDLDEIDLADREAAEAEADSEREYCVDEIERMYRDNKTRQNTVTNTQAPMGIADRISNFITTTNMGIQEKFKDDVDSEIAVIRKRLIHQETEKYRVKDLKSAARYLAEKCRIITPHVINQNPEVDRVKVTEYVFKKFIDEVSGIHKQLENSAAHMKDEKDDLNRQYKAFQEVAAHHIQLYEEAQTALDLTLQDKLALEKKKPGLRTKKIKNPRDQVAKTAYDQCMDDITKTSDRIERLERVLADTESDMEEALDDLMYTKAQSRIYEETEKICKDTGKQTKRQIRELEKVKKSEDKGVSIRNVFEVIAKALEKGKNMQEIYNPFMEKLDNVYGQLANAGTEIRDSAAFHNMKYLEGLRQKREKSKGNIVEVLKREVDPYNS